MPPLAHATYTPSEYTQNIPLFPVQCTWPPPCVKCCFLCTYVQYREWVNRALLRLTMYMKEAVVDYTGDKCLSPDRGDGHLTRHSVHVKLACTHTHKHTCRHTCLQACTMHARNTCMQQMHTHSLYSLWEEVEEENWQYDPLDPEGQTHLPEVQVPPLLAQDKEHPAYMTHKGTKLSTTTLHEVWNKELRVGN